MDFQLTFFPLQVNTKKVELDYFGAPLAGSLDTTVYNIPAPLDY